MEGKNEKKTHLLVIAFIVLVVLIAFVLTFGNYFPKEEPAKKIYDDIDFNKLHENIENEIKSRNDALTKIKEEKELLLAQINKSINLLKGFLAGLWIIVNTTMFLLCYPKYSLNEFIQFNEATIIVLIFILFMISEKYTSLHLAFEALKKIIIRKVSNKFDLNIKIENKLKNELYVLEAIYHVHPSIILKKDINK